MPQNEIVFTLVATVDDEEVYRSDFPDTTMLQEDGLRKAEHQVGLKINMEGETEDDE